MSATYQRPQHPPFTKHVRLPEFDGTQNVKGFMVLFELGCEEMGLTESSKKACLAGRLKGAAAAWVQGLAEDLYGLSYPQLKQALLDHFQGETLGQVRKL